jgi:integrase
MANLFKPPVTKTNPETGEKIKGKTKKWYGRYRDENGIEHRIPLSENKNTAQQMLAEIVKQISRVKSGLAHSAETEMKKPILSHVADFEISLKSRNNTSRYIHDTMMKIKRCVESCRWRTPAQIKKTDVEQFLVELRETHGCSIETSNHYLRSIKSFCLWLHDNKRVIEKPLRKMPLLNSQVDRRHDRRALSNKEFCLLIDAAESGPPVEGIVGPDRAMLYLLAAYTGLRKGELGSLTVKSFDLNDSEDDLHKDNETPATVTIEAAYAKNRRQDTLILHPDLVKRLKSWIARKRSQTNEILFPISQRSGGVERKTAKMIRFDLESARTFWIAEAETEKEEKKRQVADFLLYRDEKGKFADFHCLRHTFITNLGKAKVPAKTAQSLARHSDIKLTLGIYTHIDQEDKIQAIHSLPSLETEKETRYRKA